jgi:hypothetical protein
MEFPPMPEPFLQHVLPAFAGCGVGVVVDMTGNVTALRPKERVRLDAEPIAVLYRNLGTSTAEQVVSRALGELALTLAGLADQVRLHDLGDLGRDLRRLQRMADHLGMISLGLSAAEARICLDRADDTAFAAVWARLIRVAEASLATDGALLDQSL